jgi:hypothetical protein
MVRNVFEDKDGIQELHVAVNGFVALTSLPRFTPSQISIFDYMFCPFSATTLRRSSTSYRRLLITKFRPYWAPFPKLSCHVRLMPILESRFTSNLTIPVYFAPVGNRETRSIISTDFSGKWKFPTFLLCVGHEKQKTKNSFSLTLKVLDERKRLESTMDGLQPLIKINKAKGRNAQNQTDDHDLPGPNWRPWKCRVRTSTATWRTATNIT